MNINDLKSANRIETIAARYAVLHRAGANYKMLCPFHDDHHPSLSLHVGKQYFKCHACGAGGDVIALVQGLEKCTFAEALEILGGKEQQAQQPQRRMLTQQGAQQPQPQWKQQAQQQEQQPQPNLNQQQPSPQQNHHHQPTQTIQPSSVPSSPSLSTPTTKELIAGNEAFLRSLLPCGSGHTDLSPTWLDFEVGISPALVPPAFGSMRNRLIFPIRNAEGILTGFGARRIDTPASTGENVPHTPLPKYINTSNNGLYEKSFTLYGIHRAADAIRRAGYAFLVEGYKDVLAMHAAGFRNTVALSGTSLTDGQAAELSHLTHRLILLTDGDKAGREAAARIRHERQRQFLIRICLPPSADDPDELFRRLGRDAFRLYLRHLTAKGCLSARRLLYYCLCYPSAAPHVERMLESDDLPFPDPDYNELLHALALSCPPELYPENTSLLAAFLRALAPQLLPELPSPPGVPAEMLSEQPSLPTPEITDRLRLEYYEERILANTDRLRKLLQSATTCSFPEPNISTDPKTHKHLVRSFEQSKQQLTRITGLLDRTPAVGGRWFK